MAEVQLKNIGKTYEGGMQAVKEVSLTIKDKEFIVLVGPSGCGKSTTLRMIAGLEEITTGELLIDGEKVNDMAPNQRHIAMVFQNYALYPHMTAYDNMAFGLKIKRTPKAEIKERVMKAAEILNIEDILYKKPGKMSGGQRQRIAIGRAIVRRPKVFLFDEPLSNLDAKLRGQMRIELAKLHRKLDATIVYVTHDQVEAMTLGDRIVIMNKGEVIQIATPVELFMNPTNRFVAEFIGTPQMNFLSGEVGELNQKLVFKNQNLTFDLSKVKLKALGHYKGKKVDLGIRSEEIYASAANLENYATLSAKIHAVELLGNEKLIYAEYEGNHIIAKFRTSKAALLGSNIDFFINLDKAYFFEKEGGLRIF
ncbi:MAG: sn-glycerol-3-phosphate ABC transporter ATP-binding protein UgpC [Saprospiraceae bacterium]